MSKNTTINKEDIARELATKNGKSIKENLANVNDTFDVIFNAITAGNTVYIKDFGKFAVAERKCSIPGKKDSSFVAKLVKFKVFEKLAQAVK